MHLDIPPIFFYNTSHALKNFITGNALASFQNHSNLQICIMVVLAHVQAKYIYIKQFVGELNPRSLQNSTHCNTNCLQKNKATFTRTTPTHKIETQETKNLQQSVELQNQSINHQTCHIKQKIKGHLVSWTKIIERDFFLV